MVNYQTTGDSSYILDEYRKQNAAGKKTMDSLVNDAGNYGSKSKDQVKYINEQVQALERLNKIKYQTAQTKLQDGRDVSFASIGDQIARRGLTGTAAQQYATQKTKEINSDYRENSTLLREEFNEAKTQTSQLRSVIDTIRMTGKEEILNAKGNANVIADRIKILEKSTDPNDRAVASYMKAYAPEKPENKLSLFAQAVMGSMLNAAQKGIVQMAGSKNAYDMVRPAMNTVSGFAGTSTALLASLGGEYLGDASEKLIKMFGKKTGTLIAKLGKGIAANSPQIGAIIQTVGDVAGEEMARNMEAEQDVRRNVLKTRAITGQNIGVADLRGMGITYEQVALKQGEVAKAYGNAENLNSRTANVMAIPKAVGIGENSIMEMISFQRNTGKSIVGTLEGIRKAGAQEYGFEKDRSFFPEFTEKFLGLQKEFMKSSTKVSDATTYDVMSMFNSVGGQFQTNDIRGMGNIGSVQNSLSNPGSDAMKAMSYNVLRQLNPNMGIADLQLEMSKGMQSNGYLQSMMKAIESLGGGEDYQRMVLSGSMGLSPQAAKELYKNKDAIINGEIRQGNAYSESSFYQDEAAMNTNASDSYFAGIQNEFVTGALDGLQEIADKFIDVVREAFSKTTIMKTADGEIRFQNPGLKVNIVKKGN